MTFTQPNLSQPSISLVIIDHPVHPVHPEFSMSSEMLLPWQLLFNWEIFEVFSPLHCRAMNMSASRFPFFSFLRRSILAIISDFLYFTLAYRNSHQLGINWLTEMFKHSTESLDQGQSNRICLGGLRTLWGPEKRKTGGAHVHCTAV